MPLSFLEFLGTSELVIIMVVALMVFGPRKLPELGRSLGRGISEFKRASDDLKRTWESEVETSQRVSVVHSERAKVAAEPTTKITSTEETFNGATEPMVEAVSAAA